MTSSIGGDHVRVGAAHRRASAVGAARLEALSWALPLTYAYDALVRATAPAPLEPALLFDVLAVAGFGIAALGLGALMLRRRTA